jgi:thymidylate synthase (FAD)
MTPDALALLYAACRQCYSAHAAADIMDAARAAAETDKQVAFVRAVVASGHESPLEHVSFSFGVEGVSRALTHQLVRHRIASYSQQSQRYVNAEHFDYIEPPSIAADPEAHAVFVRIMEEVRAAYSRLLACARRRGVSGEQANQDARFILPQATETKIVVTMNCRQLLHFFRERCCTRAQWEIRSLAGRMLDVCRRELPAVFENAGAKCEQLGYCPEGEKFTCSRYPVRRR